MRRPQPWREIMADPSKPDPLTPGPEPVVFDDAHLDRQTLGDEDLRVEILALFSSEAERLLIQAERAGGAARLGERLHAIKGLARNVGALRLETVAATLETDCRAGSIDLAPLRHAVMEAIEYLHNTSG